MYVCFYYLLSIQICFIVIFLPFLLCLYVNMRRTFEILSLSPVPLHYDYYVCLSFERTLCPFIILPSIFMIIIVVVFFNPHFFGISGVVVMRVCR